MLLIIARISLILFLVAVPFLFYGFGRETLGLIPQISPGNPRWFAFLVGAAAFIPSLLVAKRLFPATWSYLQTLEHELTHLLVGLLFLKIPVGIRVSAHEGGEVRQIGLGTTGQTWVTLAPYFFPTVSLAVLIFAYFAGLSSGLLLGILGWTTVFHLVTNWSETSFRQPDLQKAGLLKTLLILPVMNLICYGSVLAFAAGGGKGFGAFWYQGLSASLGLLKQVIFRIF